MDSKEEEISKWSELKEFLIFRTKKPISHPEFIVYFLLVILIIGGLGVWSDLFRANDLNKSISNNLNAYALTIIAASTIELIFSKETILKNTLTLISVGIIVIYIFLFFILNNNNVPTLIFSVLSTLIALYIWWIANAENSNLTKNFFKSSSQKTKELSKSVENIS